MFKPCIVIPIHNHKDSIAQVVSKISQYSLPCLIVNDGSDQDTCATLEQIASDHSFVTLIHRHKNGGKGAAVIDGLKQASSSGYSHAIQVDADGQHRPSDIPKFIELAQSNPQSLILGHPEFDDSAPKGRIYGRKITQFFIRIETLSNNIQDALCGFRCYPLVFTEKLLNKKHFFSRFGLKLGQKMDFDPEIAVRLYWLGLPIISIKTAVKYHENGLSHFHLFEDNVLISWMHTRLIIGMLFRLPWIIANKKKRQNNISESWHVRKERGSKIAMKILLGILKISGRPLVNLILYPVIGYFVLSDQKRRNESKDYLQKVNTFCPDNTHFNSSPRTRHVFKHYYQFAQSVLDRIQFWQDEKHQYKLNWHGFECISQQLETQRGAILLSAHFGSVDMMRALHLNKYKVGNKKSVVNLLMYTEHAQKFNALMQQINPDFNTKIISVDNLNIQSAMEMSDCIEQGEFIATMGDRVPTSSDNRNSQVDFLGKPALFPQGAFILASLLKCPVYLIFGIQTKKDTYDLIFKPFADQIILPRKNREEAIKEYVEKYAKELEKMCCQYPYQWYNFYDFWKR